MTGRLDGKRVLVTQANDYMGPITIEVFERDVFAVSAWPLLFRDVRVVGSIFLALRSFEEGRHAGLARVQL